MGQRPQARPWPVPARHRAGAVASGPAGTAQRSGDPRRRGRPGGRGEGTGRVREDLRLPDNRKLWTLTATGRREAAALLPAGAKLSALRPERDGQAGCSPSTPWTSSPLPVAFCDAWWFAGADRGEKRTGGRERGSDGGHPPLHRPDPCHRGSEPGHRGGHTPVAGRPMAGVRASGRPGVSRVRVRVRVRARCVGVRGSATAPQPCPTGGRMGRSAARRRSEPGPAMATVSAGGSLRAPSAGS